MQVLTVSGGCNGSGHAPRDLPAPVAKRALARLRLRIESPVGFTFAESHGSRCCSRGPSPTLGTSSPFAIDQK